MKLRAAAILLSLAAVTFAVFSKEILSAQWTPQRTGATATFRGASIVNGAVAWICGSKGTYARTLNGGLEWQHGVVPGAEGLDFRDVQAIDASTAHLLSSGPGNQSRIYKTMDGGKTWRLQFMNSTTTAFFDGLAFWDSVNGIAFSDPVEGHFLIIRTNDGGESWWEIPGGNAPQAMRGETAFAASGSSIVVQGTTNVWIATGGAVARVLRSADRGLSWQASNTPLVKGSASAGIFSIAFRDELNGVIVGGDYKQPKLTSANFARTNDGGRTWVLGKRLPGYRSAVTYVANPDPSPMGLLAVGPSGTDYSDDNGTTWQSIGTQGYHAVSFLNDLPIGWAVGESGAIGKWVRRVE